MVGQNCRWLPKLGVYRSLGESGLDGTTLLPKPVASEVVGDAVEAMYEALMETPAGTAWLVATGALTNVAALVDRHPDLGAHVAGISVMGGAFGDGLSVVTAPSDGLGNVTPEAEFNVR